MDLIDHAADFTRVLLRYMADGTDSPLPQWSQDRWDAWDRLPA